MKYALNLAYDLRGYPICSSRKEVARFWKGLSVLGTSSKRRRVQRSQNANSREHCWPEVFELFQFSATTEDKMELGGGLKK